MSNHLTFIHTYTPAKNASPRVLLMLHGTGGDETSLISFAGVLDPDAAILSVRGKVLENGAPRFFRRLQEGVFDMEDLHFRTKELADFIVAAGETYGFHVNDVIAVGYSNGANIASSILFSRPEVLGGAILFRAMVPFVPEDNLDLSGKPILLLEGKYDPLVPLENAEHLAILLQDRNAKVSLRWTELDHRIGRSELNDAQWWLSQLVD